MTTRGKQTNTRSVKRGQAPVFVVQYSARNAGGQEPTGTLSLTKAGKPLGTFTLEATARDGNPALDRQVLLADHRFAGKLFAHFVVLADGASAKRDRKFTVK